MMSNSEAKGMEIWSLQVARYYAELSRIFKIIRILNQSKNYSVIFIEKWLKEFVSIQLYSHLILLFLQLIKLIKK